MDMSGRTRVLLRIMSGDKTGALRLRKRHDPKVQVEPTPDDGAALVAAQSVRDAVMAALIVIILFSALWAMASTLIDRIFPWLTLLLGLLLGLAVRRAGRGLDWRFPLIAAVFAALGALVGNIVVAAAFTAAELDMGTLAVLRRATVWTWPAFFEDVMTPADAVFALFAAAIAGSFANRRLDRVEFLALRRWQAARVSQKRD